MGIPEKPTLTYRGVALPVSFSVNGLCSVEEAFDGMSLEKIGAQLAAGRAPFALVRSMFRALLFDAMPGLTAIDAGKVLQEVGAQAGGDAIQAAFEMLKAGQLGPALSLPPADPLGRLVITTERERFTLAFHFNAMAELDAVFPGLTMVEIARELQSEMSLSRLRILFRAALIDDRETNLIEAGDIMGRIGIATVAGAVGAAFLQAFPKVPENAGDHGAEGQQRAAGKGGTRPTKRQPKGGTSKP